MKSTFLGDSGLLWKDWNSFIHSFIHLFIHHTNYLSTSLAKNQEDYITFIYWFLRMFYYSILSARTIFKNMESLQL